MKVFLISKDAEWEEYDGAVIVAESKEHALDVLKNDISNEPPTSRNYEVEAWGFYREITITEIDLSIPKVLLKSFRSG